MNDNLPNHGTPGIAGGPPAPPRLGRVRYTGAILAQASMALGMVAIVWAASAFR